MGQVSSFHIIGSIITLSLIIFTGIYTGRKVKDAKDFSTGAIMQVLHWFQVQ